MVHFKSSPLFQIRLQDNTLTLHGSQSESVGCVLRGQLVLAIPEPTKIKEIKLTFQGTSKISWVDGTGKGQYFHDEERILYQHDWTFLPARKQYHVLEPNNYHWDFELVLPGTLPETIEGCQHGSVKYTLKAVAERPTFAVNLHTQREVTLLRSLLPSLENLQSAIMASTWINKVEYEFSANSSVFSLGDKISVLINLRSLDDLKIQSILCVFKEYTTYRIRTCKKQDSKTIRSIYQQTDSWNHFMEIQIPNNLNECHYDSQNDIIRICHKLKFYVKFINDQNRVCELRATLPITITSISPDSDIMTLPAYNENENVLEKIYSDNDSLISNNSSLSSSSLSSSPCSSTFSDLEIEELSKLPSYRSITSFIPAPLADSLLPPTYDAIY
jgi:hypothetical protein